MFNNTFNIPEHTFNALRRYVDDGLEPGGFLTAVLSNDLFGAFGRADHINIGRMKDIVMHIYNEEPAGCHGSKETINNWIERKRG